MATTSQSRIRELQAVDRGGVLTALEVAPRFYDPERERGRVYPLVVESPGVYAAWLEHPGSLRQAGISAKPPVALYVGKAVRGNGLPQRLTVHLDVPWLELMELLALAWDGGEVLSPFAGRVNPLEWEKVSRDPDPMTRRGLHHTRDWLLDNVVWTWTTCPKEEARQLEREAIDSVQPLLNIAELPAYPPPLMRSPILPRIRAQWLWHMSWAGLLLGAEAPRLSAAQRKRWRFDDPDTRYQADALGFPVADLSQQGSRATIGRSDCPAGNDLWEFFMAFTDVEPPIRGWVRHALGQGMRRNELRVWWAAHAAAPLLPQPVTVETAVEDSLKLVTVPARPGPSKLPSAARCRELAALAATVPRFRH